MLSETLYGVGGNFHSSAEQLLALLYSFLSRTDVNTKVLQTVLSGAVKRLVFKVKIDNFSPFWNITPVRSIPNYYCKYKINY